MLEVVSMYMVCLITHTLDCYVFSKFINEKFKINIKNMFIIILLSTIDYIFGTLGITTVKFITSNLATFLILKLIYNKNYYITLIGTLFTYLGYVIAEGVFSIIFIIILKIDLDFFWHNIYGMIMVNVIVIILYINLFRLKFYTNFVLKIMKWYKDNKFIELLIKTLVAFSLCYIIIISPAVQKLSYNMMILIYSIVVGITLFIIGYFNQKSNNNQLTSKYDQLLEYVRDYETEVVEKGKAIHEHKNQLAVIDGMIPKNNKELKKYVSEKLENIQKVDDNIWLEKLTNLPTGGTKGLVYLKIKKMLENNISIYVEIDDELKNKNNWDIVKENLEDYTRILGVYLDNAIEASLDSKDKQIVIEFVNNENNIEFILSNTYKGIINFTEIDKEQFSTKGKNRGYGLSLVKDIINKNKNISQKREINGKFYVQKLYIEK